MTLIFRILFCLLVPAFATAQKDMYFETWSKQQADSLNIELQQSSDDTLKMFISRCLGYHYQEINRDSSLYFHHQQLALARKLNLKLWQGDALDQAGWVLSYLKNYSLSLEYFQEGLKILQNPDCEKKIWRITLFSSDKNPREARLRSLGFIYNDLSQLYKSTGDRIREIATLNQGLKIGQSIQSASVLALIKANLAQACFALNHLDSSLFFGQESLEHIRISKYKTYKGYVLNTIGNVYLQRNQFELAKLYLDSSIITNIEQNSVVELPDTYLSLAELYKSRGKMDSALFYAKKALASDNYSGSLERINQAYVSIYELYKAMGRADSAYSYLQLSKILSDSLNKVDKQKLSEYQTIGFSEQLKIKKQENERIQREAAIRTYTLVAGILVMVLIAFLFYRNNRIRRKANELLQKQKEQIEKQKLNVESTLSELQSTQAQLIQSEKMASLGELTAGIAHEIQNPLNFVNNFSEVNKELLDELNEEAKKGNLGEVQAIANDIKENEEKINYHGKRADAIVKGMLQHSSSSTGINEPTDINGLADEYLRLTYHGLRAKNKDFNAIMKTNFDQSIRKINVIPQDMGRVLLNLYNNAFYAVSEKNKITVSDYEPTVSVSTKKTANKIMITVKDNGNGIPQKVIDKIFQPFFTTKPTGQGTGLGLSLAYDIIKAHGGNIKVESNEGEFTQFIIILTE